MADYSGLNFQVASLRVGGGQTEGDEEWLVTPPKNIEVVNGRFDARGSVGKRFGSEELSTTGKPPGTGGDPVAVYAAQDRVHMLGPEGTFAYDPELPGWQDIGKRSPRSCRCITDPLVRGNNTQRGADVSFVGNVGCVVWQDDLTASGVSRVTRYQFFDATTLAALSPPRDFTDWYNDTYASGDVPNIVGNEVSETFFVTCRDFNDDYEIRTYQLSAGTYTFGAPTSWGDQLQPTDILAFGSNALVLSNNGSTTRFQLWDPNAASVWFQNTVDQEAPTVAVTHNTASSQFVSIGIDGSMVFCDDDGLSVPTATATITPYSDMARSRATIAQYNSAGDMFIAISGDGYQDGASTNMVTHAAIVDSLGSVDFEGGIPNLTISGHAMSIGSGDVVVPMTFQAYYGAASAIDHSVGHLCQVVLGSGDVVTMRAISTFGLDKINARRAYPQRVHISGSRVRWAYDVLFASSGTEVFYAIDLADASLDVAPRSAFASNVTMVAGGTVSMMDGFRHMEAFPMRPPFLKTDGVDTRITSFLTSTGGAGNCRIRVCYRFIDARGNQWRSAPSPELSIAYGSGAYNPGHAPPRFVVSNPFPTALDFNETGIRWELEVFLSNNLDPGYASVGVVTPRTEATLTHPNNNVYFSGDAASRSSLGSIATITGADTTHYIDLTPALGGGAGSTVWWESELLPWPTPPMVDVVSTQDRLWGIDGENRLVVRYTKPLEFGLAPEWPAENLILVPQEGGECVGITAIDDKVVVLKQRQAYVIFGDPGDATGANSTVAPPRLISSDVGCVDSRTIAEGPWGVVFLSARGFYKVDRGLQMEFIGEDVMQSSKGQEFSCAVVVPDQSQVRWPIVSGSLEGSVLVWDYRVNAWTRFSGAPAAHACVVDGVYHRLVDFVQNVYREPVDSWGLDTSGSSLSTGWVSLAGFQGYQRIKEILFIIRHYTGRVVLNAYYDYDESSFDTWAWWESEVAAFESPNGRAQFRVKPSIRKCQSIRFDVRELTQGAEGQPVTIGRGIEVVGIDLVVGSKRTGYKRGIAPGANQ